MVPLLKMPASSVAMRSVMWKPYVPKAVNFNIGGIRFTIVVNFYACSLSYLDDINLPPQLLEKILHHLRRYDDYVGGMPNYRYSDISKVSS